MPGHLTRKKQALALPGSRVSWDFQEKGWGGRMKLVLKFSAADAPEPSQVPGDFTSG